jgi:hypothetical protein
MTNAVWPGSVSNISDRTDNLDVVAAADVNAAYAEIKSIEATLGSSASSTNPAVSPAWSSSFTSLASGNVWTTVGDRLTNIEAGLKITVPLVSSGGYITQINGGTA